MLSLTLQFQHVPTAESTLTVEADDCDDVKQVKETTTWTGLNRLLELLRFQHKLMG